MNVNVNAEVKKNEKGGRKKMIGARAGGGKRVMRATASGTRRFNQTPKYNKNNQKGPPPLSRDPKWIPKGIRNPQGHQKWTPKQYKQMRWDGMGWAEVGWGEMGRDKR